MPWQTPSLADVRGMVRDSIRAKLPGADALVPNSVLRVLSDNQGALAHEVLQYVDWLALQLIPDTAETVWLDRHGDIWLVNADASTGRKVATLAQGTVEFVSEVGGTIVPVATRLGGSSITAFGNPATVEYETLEGIITADSQAPTPCLVRALDPGSGGNRNPGDSLTVLGNVQGDISTCTVVEVGGGVDTEGDEDLRIRVLERIRQPPMGGADYDYVAWAKGVPGVTRSWAASEDLGTVTVRFMMDDLRADNDGFPTQPDVDAVAAYIDYRRPVSVKDTYVFSPIKQRVDVNIDNLMPDTTAVRAAIEDSLRVMILQKASPGRMIFAAWKSYAVMNAPEVVSFELVNTTDDVMESIGHMAVLGDITYGPSIDPENQTVRFVKR